MDVQMLTAAIDGMSPDELAAWVDGLSPGEVIALTEDLPRGQIQAVDPSSGDPADFASALDPGFRRVPHVDLLAAEIRKTVDEAITGTGPGRLIVNMPPRVGKSFTSSLWTPLWFLDRYPDRQVILASHEANFATSLGRKVRDTAKRYGQQGRITARVSREVAAASEWQTTLGGGMLSRGIGGSITGRGAHLALIDDPIKDFAQAHSAAVRQAQWDWWLSTMSTRLEPGAAVILVMTRWHEDDLAGRLLSSDFEGDPDQWRVVRIPAVGEGVMPDVEAGRIPADALDREEGEPLLLASIDETPDRARERWEIRRRDVGPYVWNGMYQQRPSEPEGAILKRGWWQFYRREDDEVVRGDGTRVRIRDLRVVQSWDMAFKDTSTSSYVVGQVWGADGRHGDRFLLDQFRDQTGFAETKRAMRQLRDRWPDTEATYVEAKANGPAIISDLRGELSGLIPVEPRGSKESRAWAVQGDLEAGSHYLPTPEQAEWVHRFMDEAAEFPSGSHDDQVDAYTQAIDRLRGAEGALWRQTWLDGGRLPQLRPADVNRRIVAVSTVAVPDDAAGSEFGVAVGCTLYDGTAVIEASEGWDGTPKDLARQTIDLYHRVRADGIAVEVKHGGEWLPEVIRQLDPSARVITVAADDGGRRSVVSPVASLFQPDPDARLPYRGRLHGEHPDLERQMTTYTGDPAEAVPARLAAAVWLMQELVIRGHAVTTGTTRDLRLAGRR